MLFARRLPLALSTTLGLFLVGATVSADTMRIGVVDTMYAIAHTEDGMRAKATLNKELSKRQSELSGKEQELMRQREEIEKQAKVLSREALQRKADDWQRQMLELRQKLEESTRDLQKKEHDLLGPVQGKVRESIKQLAGKEGYDLIVDASAVPFARRDLDLTDKVIQIANGRPAGAASAAPAPGGSGR